MFIKQGDGKIVSVIDEDELSEEQKKALKDLSKTSKDKSKDNDDLDGR